MHKKMVSAETVDITKNLRQSQLDILLELSRQPDRLQKLDKLKLSDRYILITAYELRHFVLIDIDRKTRLVKILEAGQALLEGRQPTLHSLIRLDKLD